MHPASHGRNRHRNALALGLRHQRSSHVLLAPAGVSVTGVIATLSVAFDYGLRLWSVALRLLTDAATARVVAALADAYDAKNTRRACIAPWKRWQVWASDHGVRAMPATPMSVAAYLTARTESGRAPATVRLDRAAIGAALSRRSIPPPPERYGARFARSA